MRLSVSVTVLLLAGCMSSVWAADLTGVWSASPNALRCKQYSPGSSAAMPFTAGHTLAVSQTGNDIRAQLAGSGISSEVGGLYFGGIIEGSEASQGRGLITQCLLGPFDSPYSATSIEIVKARVFPPDASSVSGRAKVRIVHYFSPVGSPGWRTMIFCKGRFDRLQTNDPAVPSCL